MICQVARFYRALYSTVRIGIRDRKQSMDHFLRSIKHCRVHSSHSAASDFFKSSTFLFPIVFSFSPSKPGNVGMGRVRVGSNMPEIVEGKHRSGRKRKEGRGLREMRHVLLAQTVETLRGSRKGRASLRNIRSLNFVMLPA